MGRFARVSMAAVASLGAVLALCAPAGSGGREPSGPDGLLVLGTVGSRDRSGAVTSERVLVADPRSGATRSHRLPGGTLCAGVVRSAGDGVVFPSYSGRRAIARTLPLDLRGRPRSLGRADVAAPLGASGRLLLARARLSRRRTVVGPLREAGPYGQRVITRRLVLPGWATLEAGVDGGLVLSHGRRLTLWDPERDRARLSTRGASLLAAGGRRFAWCSGACTVVRVWTPAGRLTVPARPGTRPIRWIRGALSPDERRLALAIHTGSGVRVAIADLAAGSWEVVRGARVSGYRSMAWSPSGRWLLFTAGERRLMAWRSPAQEAVELPVRVPGTIMSVATAG